MSKPLHYRELRSWPLSPVTLTPEQQEFVDSYIWPVLGIECGRPSAELQRKQIAHHIAHDLIGTGLIGGVVADSRNTAQSGARSRIEVWEAFIQAGLCRKCTGSEQSGHVTRYRATGQLMDLSDIVGYGLIAPQSDEDCPLFCHTGKLDILTGEPLPENEQRQPLTLSQAARLTVKALRESDGKYGRAEVDKWLPTFLNHWKGIIGVLDGINSSNIDHGWKAWSIPEHDPAERGLRHPRQVDPKLRMVCSNLLTFSGNRLYTWGKYGGQSLTKQQRQEMLIDGEPAAEFDCQAHFIRLFYHLNGQDPQGDLYHPEIIFPVFSSWPNASEDRRGVVRDFVKKSTVIALNSNSRLIAQRGVSLFLRHHPERQFLNNVIFNTEQTNLNGVLDRLLKLHHPLSETFCNRLPSGFNHFPGIGCSLTWQNVGSVLMGVDGHIMTLAMIELSQRKIPALAIHDSLVVKAGQYHDAQQIYADKYHSITGFWPTLKRAF